MTTMTKETTVQTVQSAETAGMADGLERGGAEVVAVDEAAEIRAGLTTDLDDALLSFANRYAPVVESRRAGSEAAKTALAMRRPARGGEFIRALVRNLIEQLARRQEWREDDATRMPPLHESLIGNLREVCAVMPQLNVGDDPFLAGLIEKIGAELASVEIEVLKVSAPARQAVIEKASSILDALALYEAPAVVEPGQAGEDGEAGEGGGEEEGACHAQALCAQEDRARRRLDPGRAPVLSRDRLLVGDRARR